MAIIDKIGLCRGLPFDVVSNASTTTNDDSKSYSFSPVTEKALPQIQLQLEPSTGTMADVTTCKPQLQSLASDGITWAKVTDIDLVAIPVQILSISNGVYKLTFSFNTLVTINGATVDIEARLI